MNWQLDPLVLLMPVGKRHTSLRRLVKKYGKKMVIQKQKLLKKHMLKSGKAPQEYVTILDEDIAWVNQLL